MNVNHIVLDVLYSRHNPSVCSKNTPPNFHIHMILNGFLLLA